jgi:hypothetical protein
MLMYMGARVAFCGAIVTLLGKKVSVVRTAYAKVLHAAGFLYTKIGLEPESALDSAAG